MIKPSIKTLTKNMTLSHGVYYAKRGDPRAPYKVFLLGNTHGQEIAGGMAVAKLLEQEWVWPDVQMTAVIQDPRGLAEEGYGFVGADGSESCWPPLWGYRKNEEMYWLAVDENSAWGNTAIVPDRHKMMRELMHELEPNLTLSLHETVRSEIWRDLFWAGAGILIIETWPISTTEVGFITNELGGPLFDPISWSLRLLWKWIKQTGGNPLAKKEFKGLRDNINYRVTTSIANRYVENGGELCGPKWMRYLALGGDDLVIGQGRLLHGPMFMESDWRTATDYAVGNFGCIGITTETFPAGEMGLRGIDSRVAQQFSYVISTLDEVNENHQIIRDSKE